MNTRFIGCGLRVRGLRVVGLVMFAVFGVSIGYATTIKSEWVLRDQLLRGRVIRAVQEYLRFALDDSLAAKYVAARTQTADVVIEAIDNREENTRRLVAINID